MTFPGQAVPPPRTPQVGDNVGDNVPDADPPAEPIALGGEPEPLPPEFEVPTAPDDTSEQQTPPGEHAAPDDEATGDEGSPA
jgi:hypothetical protein